MNDIEKARNPHTSFKTLNQISQGNLTHDLIEALLMNPSLPSDSLPELITKCSIDLQILALKHPNLSSEQQIDIISSINNDQLRIKAKIVLLQRPDIGKDMLTVLCLDPDKQIRERALEKLLFKYRN